MIFSDLNLNTPLLNALDEMGLHTPTTIQYKAFPVIMSGRDVIGVAQTGTGKTLAYLLPCLRKWTFNKDPNPTILVLVPTRELAVQVAAEASDLARYMNFTVGAVYGGTNINTQAAMVAGGLDLLVATPGRLLDLVLNGHIRLKSVRHLVLDEADEMLDLGFRTQITSILELLPARKQNLLFSATLTGEIDALVADFFSNPEVVEAAPAGTPLSSIYQVGYLVPNFNTKVNLLHDLFTRDEEYTKVMVFVSTRRLADKVHERLESLFPGKVGIIHSDKPQNARFNAVKQFQEGKSRMLVATDIVARGLDIEGVSHVVNFDLPGDPATYIHRVGRTGRADQKGVAITLFTPADEELKIAIESFMQLEIQPRLLPDGVEVSTELVPEEIPEIPMKNVLVKVAPKEAGGGAFHEKKAKNKKFNTRVPRAMAMKKKYKKPKTRGQKKR